MNLSFIMAGYFAGVCTYDVIKKGKDASSRDAICFNVWLAAAFLSVTLAGCQTTSPDLDTLPDYLGDIVIDEEPRPAPVEPEVDTPVEPTIYIPRPFGGTKPGIKPQGCRDLLEADPEANCR